MLYMVVIRYAIYGGNAICYILEHDIVAHFSALEYMVVIRYAIY